MYFSIIIPTRNRPEHLTNCLNHIKSQTFSDYEVIIVDDGSNLEILKQYETIIPSNNKFRLTKQSTTSHGLGASISRNIGLNIAKGRYIAFCDDDDFWTEHEHLQIAFDAINNSNVDIYISNQQSVLSNGRIESSDWLPHLSANIQDYKLILKNKNIYELTLNQLMKESEIPQLNTIILHKNICEKINGFWSRLSNLEDRDFYLRALEHCNTIYYRKDIVSQHNIPDINKIKSISNSVSEADQHILMITVLHHVIANSNRKEIIVFCKKFLGWKYRNLAQCMNKHHLSKSSAIFSENALISAFSFKWFGYNVYLKIKLILKSIFKRI